MAATLRRALFDNLWLTLALMLGGVQVLLWHWWSAVVRGGEGPGALQALVALAALVTLNGLALPVLRRHRRGRDWRGRLARLYTDVGISTLLVGSALLALGALFALPVGLVGALGTPDLAWSVFRWASVGLVGSVVLLLLWGFSVGQARVVETELELALPGLAPELAGLRVAHVTDLHIGNHLDGARLERLVARVNAAGADLIVLTGDLFDFDPAHVEEGARALAGLSAPRGVYAILGNHDHYTGAEAIARALARHAPGLRLLRDEIARVPGPAPFYLAGSEDPGRDWAARDLRLESLERLARERPGDGATLLLVHRPELFFQAAELGFPLVLAGHTHGGQLALPLPGGRVNLARVMTPLTRGLYRSGASTLYVNRGLGVGGPALRINCPREIALLTLVPASA